MLAPTAAPASKTTGSKPRASRCAAAARPTGPAPITATRSGFEWFTVTLLCNPCIEEFRCDVGTVAEIHRHIKFFRYALACDHTAPRHSVLRSAGRAKPDRGRGRRAR